MENHLESLIFYKNADGKKIIHTWVYSVLFIVALLVSLPIVFTTHKERPKVTLLLNGVSLVNVETSDGAISSVTVEQLLPKDIRRENAAAKAQARWGMQHSGVYFPRPQQPIVTPNSSNIAPSSYSSCPFSTKNWDKNIIAPSQTNSGCNSCVH
jgi:hypothetical protein